MARECTDDSADAKVAVVELLLAADVEHRSGGTLEFEDHGRRMCCAVTEDAATERVLGMLMQHHPRLLEYVDAYGTTVLHSAIEMKQVQKIKFMVEAGADVNSCGGRVNPAMFTLFAEFPSSSPSTRASYHVKLRVTLRILISAGVDLGVVDVAGQTVFMTALSGDMSHISSRSHRDDAATAVFIRDMAEAVLSRGLRGSALAKRK